MLLQSLFISLIRGSLVKCGMLAFFVVKVKPDGQIPREFGPSFIVFEVDPFVFQRAPEALDKDVVFEPALAVHADLNVPSFQDGGKGLAGKLAALVGIEYLRSAVREQCFLKCLDAKTGVEGVGQLPGQNLAGCQSMMAIRYR